MSSVALRGMCRWIQAPSVASVSDDVLRAAGGEVMFGRGPGTALGQCPEPGLVQALVPEARQLRVMGTDSVSTRAST